jgi:hypothetical protein
MSQLRRSVAGLSPPRTLSYLGTIPREICGGQSGVGEVSLRALLLHTDLHVQSYSFIGHTGEAWIPSIKSDALSEIWEHLERKLRYLFSKV